MNTRRTSFFVALAAAFIGAGLAGCDSNPSRAQDDPDGPGNGGTAGLACTEKGFPCDLADVPMDLLETGESLADEVLVRLEAGEGTEAILDWLLGQEGMAEAEGDETVTVFRLDGAPPVWILRAASLAHNLQAAAAEAAATVPHLPLGFTALVDAAQAPLSGVATTGTSKRPADGSSVPNVVVGDEPESKSALVLSPFKYQFGESDEGESLTDLLVATRGYAGNVVYKKNETPGSQQVTLADFQNWAGFDVVHLSTHGNTKCNATGCSQLISTGVTYGSIEELLELTTEFQGIGAYQTKIEGSTVSAISLGGDFFANKYPGGLENTLIFFSACRSFGNFNGQPNSEIADALQGTTSVFLGWSDVTKSSTASSASLAFYGALADDGLEAAAAYRTLGSLGISIGVYKGIEYTSELILGLRPAGGDLRIREIVTLLDPLTAEMLEDGHSVVIDGATDDGVADRLPYRIRVDGVREENTGRFDVHLTVGGGDPLDLSLVANGEKVDEFAWEITGLAELGFDALEGQEVDLRAWADLPDQGISEHAVSVALTGGTPLELRFCSTMDFSWPDIGSTHGEVLAKINLNPQPEADRYSAGPQELKYVTFERTVANGDDCTITAELTDGTLAVPDALIRISNGAVAEDTEVVVNPDGLRERNRIECGGNVTEFSTTEWIAAWTSFHSGVLANTEDEFDPDREGWVIQGWEAADGEGICDDPDPPAGPVADPGELLARRSYVRTAPGPEAGTTFTENTVIEIRTRPQ
jgi:hypothetical protein